MEVFSTKLNYSNAIEIIKQYDIILDGSDNFATRYIINDTCLELNKVHIYGAIFQFEGHISVFNYQGGPNYRNFHNKIGDNNLEEDTCSNTGVLGLLPGIIGTLQATETIKIVLGYKSILSGIILKYNALDLSFKKFRIINKNFLLLPPSLLNRKRIIPTDNYVIREINILQFQTLLSNNKLQYILIDVRNIQEYRSAHLKNSLNIPLSKLKTQNYSNLIKQTKTCFVYCSLDSRSIFASKFLIKQGFNIIRIQGGLTAWKNVIGTNHLALQSL